MGSIDILKLDELLTVEQRLYRESVREYVRRELEPEIRQAYLREEFISKVPKGLGGLGILGANLSGYGLPGMDPVSYGLVMQELERCDSAIRSFASVQGALVMYPIHTFGSEAQKAYWLPRLASGDSVGCFGLTESHGGSDPAAMHTTALRQGGKWVLHGSKMWITNGNLADVAVVWARSEQGVLGFLVPTNLPGVSVKKMVGKLSLRASITSEFYFDKVILDEDALLPRAKGMKAALQCLTHARYGIAWGVIGAAEACFDEAVAYVWDRKTFGRTLGESQLVQKKLATMAKDLTHARLLVMRLGQLYQEGKLHHSQVSLAKQANVEAALNIARTCRDILGANGIMIEYVAMRHMSNLETVFTYEGTNDIHLLILGAEITGKQAFGSS